MKLFSHFTAVCTLLAIGAPSVVAQQTQSQVMPRITVVHPGAQALEKDLKALFRLTTEKEQKQWKNVKEFLDQFKEGVDIAKPIRIDFLGEQSKLPMRLAIPVTDIGAFRETLDALGFSSRRVRRDKTLYEIKDEGFLRFLNGYSSIARAKNDVAGILLGGIATEISELYAKKYSLGAEIVNTKLDAEARQARRAKFGDIRTELMSAIKKKPSETKAEFELRRAIVRHWMDEAERLLADVDRLTAGAKLTDDAESATFVTDLKAIAGSDLSNTIQVFGTTQSAFVGVKRDPAAILSLRANHPLDEMRKKNFAELWEKLLPVTNDKIDGSELSDGEKKASKELAEHMLSMMALGSQAGAIDAFVEVVPDGDKHTMVTGLKVPAECDLVKMLELFPQANTKQKLEKNVAKYGETDIHKLTLSTKYSDEFNDFFGNNKVVWVGTSDSGLWTAIGGANAQQKLKDAIEQAAAAPADAEIGPTIDIITHIRPWIDLRNKVDARLPIARDKKVKARRQEAADLRRRALNAMTPADDVITYKMMKVDGRLESITEYGTGVTRLLGKLMAKFAKEQLDF